MPAGFSSFRVAHESYRRVRENMPLYGDETPAIQLAGRNVVVVQGSKDAAVAGPKALRKYRELAAGATWQNVELIEGRFNHWPLLEAPGRFAAPRLVEPHARDAARVEHAPQLDEEVAAADAVPRQAVHGDHHGAAPRRPVAAVGQVDRGREAV